MNWTTLCAESELMPNVGVCAKHEEQQIALFQVKIGENQALFAIGNWDPIGKANVLSRGILGSIGEAMVVASPLYKQHFCLKSGNCLEQQDVSVPIYQVRVHEGHVQLLVE